MSVPYSFHAVSKVRENMKKDNTFGGGGASAQEPANSWKSGQKPAELQSYSSKMMKSIWGQYNRYSVHNFKSSQSAGASGGGQGAAADRRQDGRGAGLFN